MTIQELYELIIKKIESAERDRERQHNLFLKVKREDKATDGEILKKYFELKGKINAFTEVLELLESSGVLNEK